MWGYAVHTPDTTRSMVNPFFKHLSDEVGAKFIIRASNDTANLLERCKTGVPAIIVASMSVIKRVLEQCQYVNIAVMYQAGVLLGRDDEVAPGIDELRVIALLEDQDLSAVVRKELAQISNKFQIVTYKNYFELMNNLKEDNIQAFIAAENANSAVRRRLSDSWRVIHTFDQKASAGVLVSTSLPSELRARIASVFLANNEISKKVFQKELNLGPFVTPPNIHGAVRPTD